jgi:hypothetical protein
MSDSIAEILQSTSPFDALSPSSIDRIAASSQLQRDRVGQTIAVPQQLPSHLMVAVGGQVRILAYIGLNIPPIRQSYGFNTFDSLREKLLACLFK